MDIITLMRRLIMLPSYSFPSLFCVDE